jgi:hypothetical protein
MYGLKFVLLHVDENGMAEIESDAGKTSDLTQLRRKIVCIAWYEVFSIHLSQNFCMNRTSLLVESSSGGPELKSWSEDR